MGEPSRDVNALKLKSANELLDTLRHEFPQAQLVQVGDDWTVYTLHGVGKTEEEAILNAFAELARMQSDGRALPQILDDVAGDLRDIPGMSKARHQSLTELLQTASNCLNDGVLTNTVPWIMVPSYTRKITELQRRVDSRLAMTARDMADKQKATERAHEKPEDRKKAEWVPGKGYGASDNPLDRLEFLRKRQERLVKR